ncbi:MAG: alpha/beta hydrolase [Gemmatimonadetes bacterium]|nr:alpha/beta hydrolase [Gemmatimonadota bacterium]
MLITTNGTELFCAVHGTGTPMLLLHGGMGLDHSYFRPWLDPLGDEFELLYLDQRGNGRSARPAEWSSVDHRTWVDDVEAVRAQLGHERIFLLGHSYGGFLAQEYALRYPERLAGLVLVATAAAFEHAEVMLANAAARATPEVMDALARCLSGPAPDDEAVGNLWRAIFPLYFHASDERLMEEVSARIRFSAGAWNRSVFELMPTFDVGNRLSALQVPTLILSGRDDWIMPVDQAGEPLRRAIPDAEHVVFERSGHFPWMEEPDTFMAAIRDWLRRTTTLLPR